ncbi:DNA-processing protein DprA [Paractinoplanes atraurantiacus]|uniref:DNA processing protein n=1 Tax=Paractinoplanes atraurantiacus TaxID=1036182 RepID=A0A285FUG7_9ACTN|nr:DNA-processing protein DprA [Actinoplanes atraurantiacus]SNY14464.1 DNA processing protein [Actinoplanes atraurantiacus]
MAEDGERAARVALTWLAEPGNRMVWSLVEECGASEALDRLVRGEVESKAIQAAVRAYEADLEPERLRELTVGRADQLGARIVVPSDEEWPRRVDSLATLSLEGNGRILRDVRPPLCLWVRGAWPLGETLERSVAVVGARAATAYGTHVTGEISYGLAEQGWTVVSGGAFGIDAAAHRAAMAAGGRTVAVLACGLDRPYPAGNSAMFEQIAESGLLISEWPPGAEPLRHRFLIRNRVIAAATVGTVMVEAAARSGASQTLSRVLALNRTAMVVPGPVTSAVSVGCHELLRERPEAILVTGVDHVLEAVGRVGEYLVDPPRGPTHARDALDEESALVLEAVPRRGTASPEELAAKAGLDLRTVLRRLSLLEVAGMVERRGTAGVALTRSRASPASPHQDEPAPSDRHD